MNTLRGARREVARRSTPEDAADYRPNPRLKVVYSDRQIRQRVAQLAARIDRDYRGQTLDLAALVDNSFVFVADLARHLHVPLTCHLLHVTRKDSTWHGLPLREITYGPKPPLSGKQVLLVDGVVETGITLDFVIHSIQDQEPASLRTAALIVKTGAMKVGVTPDYTGFSCKGKFLVGYGMGIEGKFMNLPYIAEFHGQS